MHGWLRGLQNGGICEQPPFRTIRLQTAKRLAVSICQMSHMCSLARGRPQKQIGTRRGPSHSEQVTNGKAPWIQIVSTYFSTGRHFDCVESQTSSIEGSCVRQSFPWKMVCGLVVESVMFVMGRQILSLRFPSNGLSSSNLHFIQALWAPQD